MTNESFEKSLVWVDYFSVWELTFLILVLKFLGINNVKPGVAFYISSPFLYHPLMLPRRWGASSDRGSNLQYQSKGAVIRPPR